MQQEVMQQEVMRQRPSALGSSIWMLLPPLSAGGAEERLPGGSDSRQVGSDRVWSEPGDPAGRRLGSEGLGSVESSDGAESILGRDRLHSRGPPTAPHLKLVLMVSAEKKK